jgi:hypothetical protein
MRGAYTNNNSRKKPAAGSRGSISRAGSNYHYYNTNTNTNNISPSDEGAKNALREKILAIQKEKQSLLVAKNNAFSRAITTPFTDAVTSSRCAPGGPSGFDKDTKVLRLCSEQVHIMPLLGNRRLCLEFMRDQIESQGADVRGTTTTLADAIEGGSVEGGGGGGKGSTLVHSISLAPSAAMIQRSKTPQHIAAWKDSAAAERYTSESEWFSLRHERVGLRESSHLATSFMSTLGMFLTDQEVQRAAGQYKVGANARFVRDALQVLRLKLGTAGGGAARVVGDRDTTEWPWVTQQADGAVPETRLNRFPGHNSPPSFTPNGPVYTHTENVIVHISHPTGVASSGGDEDEAKSPPHRFLAAKIEIVSRRFIPDNIRPARTHVGMFAPDRDGNGGARRPEYLLSQHVSVKVAYGRESMPTGDDIAAQPVALHVATANIGSRTAPTADTGMVVHVLGRGVPTSMILGRGGGDGGSSSFFTHEYGRTYPTEVIGYGLALRWLRLLDELASSPELLCAAISPWCDMIAAAATPPPQPMAKDGEEEEGAAAETTTTTTTTIERKTRRGKGVGGMGTNTSVYDPKPQALTRAFASCPIVKLEDGYNVLVTLARYILGNTAFVLSHSTNLISSLTASTTAGGAVFIGFDSHGLEVNKSQLCMVYVPVGRDISESPAVWDPPHARLYAPYAPAAMMNPDAAVFAPSSFSQFQKQQQRMRQQEEQPEDDDGDDGWRTFSSRPGPSTTIHGRGGGAAAGHEWTPLDDDNHWSPITNISGFGDLDVGEVEYLAAATRSVFDE